MAWEEALEEHVRENEREFNRIAESFGELRTFVSEGFAKVTTRLDQLESKMDARFTAVDERFDKMDQRFDALDQRFDAMDRKFEKLSDQVALVVKAVVK